MPELPDITIYIEALRARIGGRELMSAQIRSPFLLRSVEPPLDDAVGRKAREIRRLGKRIAIGFEGGIWIVLHLMIAGRLHWLEKLPARANRRTLAVFSFASGHLTLTEAGTKRRASLHVLRGEAALAEHDPGGIEPLECSIDDFRRALRAENHTLKRALADPHLVSGIGNTYSDEILHKAGMSPMALTGKLSDAELEKLFIATREVLTDWTSRLRESAGQTFPEKVTAFRDGMAVHGRYGRPCPVCGTSIQRIRYASNETNYCPRCQTAGKLLADRALSRLLKKDWPRSIDELEQRIDARRR